MAARTDADAITWPMADLAEGLQQLARRAGFDPSSDAPPAPPEEVTGDPSELARWVVWAGARLGLEAEPLDLTAATVDVVLRKGGPAVLQCGGSARGRFVLLVRCRRARLRVLCPDHRVRTIALHHVHQVICDGLEAPLASELNRLIALAKIAPRREASVRAAITRDRLGSTRISTVWMLRLPATASFWRQLVEAGLPKRLGAMLAVFVAVYSLEIIAWGLIGAAALDGRLDLGWLTAWILLVMTLIPLQLLGTWLNATLALGASRLLKTRLLLGALRLDVEAVRRQGAGQLLGRVMESQAFESLALNSGLTSVVSLVELVLAAWVLGAGAAGARHVVLLGIWLAGTLALSVAYYRRLGAWTGLRLEMTHALVERMVGHRTTLAQESPVRRDLEHDRSINAYLQTSARLDRAALPFLVGVPGGWMIVGLAGLAPAFVSGAATAGGLAIGIGGVLLAARAFNSLASGLSSAAGAAVAWKQTASLFHAASRPVVSGPFITSRQMRPSAGTVPAGHLIDAEGLYYRYQPHGDAVIRNAHLTVEYGERLLVEGSSGSGKSTLASLLVGLRQPDAGLLLLNGLDRFTLGDAWHQFATEAPQFHENHVLTGTLGFNLLMGRNWPASEDDLKTANDLCIELGLGDLLARMPSGLAQAVGETGWQLSHGERSRIFLARALLQDAPLTILDESFASLDPESLETCLSTVLKRANTLLVIAHP